MIRQYPTGPKVIYLLGFARSGTTLLGNMLGELDGFLHVGELFYLWSQAARRRGKCGCQKSMTECSFWSEVLSMTLARFPELVPQNLEAGQLDAEVLDRAWAVQKVAHSEMSWRNHVLSRRNSETKIYLQLTEALLQSAALVSGARVIVDSSKLPRAGAPFASMPSISTYYLHVIRDSRGVVLSRQRRRARRDGDKVQLGPVTATADSLRWMRRNLAAERFALKRGSRRYTVLRYEDFISQPAASLNSIVEWVEEETRRIPLVDEKTALLGPNHTVCGNRNRFQTGEVPLRLDEMWKSAMRKRDYWLITLLTGAGLVRYGYDLRRGGKRIRVRELSS